MQTKWILRGLARLGKTLARSFPNSPLLPSLLHIYMKEVAQ